LDDNLLITKVDVLSILLEAKTTLILLNKVSSRVKQVYGATETAAQGDLSSRNTGGDNSVTGHYGIQQQGRLASSM